MIRNQWISKYRRKLGQNILLSRLLIFGLTFMVFIGLAMLIANPIKIMVSQFMRGPKVITTFFTDPLYTLPSYEARTNVLLLGMGGEEHDGGELTDTIIFFALDLKHNEVSMLSIPRDIWVPSLNKKINSAYAIGAQESTAAGYAVLEDSVYEIVDQPIHYVVGLDFNGFKELIDALGGIDVKVDRAFVDNRYPIKGKENDLCSGDTTYACRYETLDFKSGVQTFNGEMALKFSRSRHAIGEEGTDYARSLRQQKIILAIKEKISQKKILLNPGKLFEIKKIFDTYVAIDPVLNDDLYAGFAGFALAFWRSGNEIKTITLDQGTEESPGFLVNPPQETYGAWVLEPRSGSWDEFHAYFRQMLKYD